MKTKSPSRVCTSSQDEGRRPRASSLFTHCKLAPHFKRSSNVRIENPTVPFISTNLSTASLTKSIIPPACSSAPSEMLPGSLSDPSLESDSLTASADRKL